MKPDTHLRTHAQLDADRRRRSFVCTCDRPTIERLPLWGVQQCSDCGRKIAEADETADPSLRVMAQYTGTLRDGSQILVTVYGDGSLTGSTRSHRGERWSPPSTLVDT